MKGMLWTFNQYDKDPIPSVPHGHYGMLKLNVYTGEIVDANTGKVIKKLSDKDLFRLQHDPKFEDFVRKAVDFYNLIQPQRTQNVALPKKMSFNLKTFKLSNFNLSKLNILGRKKPDYTFRCLDDVTKIK